MTEDLSVGELGRTVDALRREFHDGMAGINARLDRLVPTEVYTLQSAHTDQRITALSQNVQRETGAREALEDEVERHLLAEADRRERDRQARLYHAIVPIALTLVAAAATLWAAIGK